MNQQSEQIFLDLDSSDGLSTLPVNTVTVPMNTSLIEVVFSEEVDPFSFSSANFYVMTSGSKILDQFRFSDNNTRIRFLI